MRIGLRSALAGTAAAMVIAGSLPSNPVVRVGANTFPPYDVEVLPRHDAEKMAKAEAKRERKAQKRRGKA